jgi:hypothetical protein
MTDKPTRGRRPLFDQNMRRVEIGLPAADVEWLRRRGAVSAMARDIIMQRIELSRAVTQAKQQANQTGRPVAICRIEGQLTIRAYTDIPDKATEIHIVYPAKGQHQED